MANRDMVSLLKDVATLKANDTNQSKKINEMHKALMGNGQPGIIAEWNQWKGGVKLTNIIIGSVVSILSVVVAVLAYIK